MGGTAILFQALRAGAIDVYPEYTGTIAREILRMRRRAPELAALNVRLHKLGLEAGVPLGFDNTYAIGMRRSEAERLIKQGGVEIDGQRVEDVKREIDLSKPREFLLRAGKKKFLRIVVE